MIREELQEQIANILRENRQNLCDFMGMPYHTITRKIDGAKFSLDDMALVKDYYFLKFKRVEGIIKEAKKDAREQINKY